jgi:hypothetical protein
VWGYRKDGEEREPGGGGEERRWSVGIEFGTER